MLVRPIGIAGDGSYLHAIVIRRLGIVGDGSYFHAILMDIVWMEMSSPCPDDGLARDVPLRPG